MSTSERKTASLLVLTLTLTLIAVLLVVATVAATGTVGAQTADTKTKAPDCSTVDYRGDGTSSNPYEISNAHQLQCIEKTSTSPRVNDSFVQVGDIDASETSDWNGGAGFDPIGEPIPGNLVAFNGSFDGDGNNITGLTIDRPGEDFVGLFSIVRTTGEITDVTLVDVNVTGSETVGSLVGGNLGTVERSSASGEVNGSLRVGGLIAENDGGGTVTESYATVNVTGDERVGGFVGLNGVLGTVRDSYARGDATGGDVVGGFVGANEGGTVERSYATGEVDGDSDVGGFVGSNNGTVTDAYWDVDTSGQSSSDGGMGFTTEEMTGDAASDSMTGFDFGGTWSTTGGYPVLAWQIEGGDSNGEGDGSDEEDGDGGSDSSSDDDGGGMNGDSTDGDDEDNNGTEGDGGDGDGDGEGMPGFTVVATLLALVAGIAVIVRRES